jgi:glutamyl-tRNA reductase
MPAELFVLGTSQSVAPAHVRERMHVDRDDVYAGIRRLLDVPGLMEEAVPLATCGRLEVYCLSERPRRAVRVLKDLVSARTGLAHEELADHSYVRRSDEAVRHLFRVAAGLDSIIYGEAQILGQVREAMMHPCTDAVAGSYMKRLFQSALAAGKRVRSETAIGRGAASLAGAALRLLESEARTFDGMTALVLGAGETASLVARLLRKAGVARLIIANRTLFRAQLLAAEVGGEAWELHALPRLVTDADVIVGAVSGRDNLVTLDLMRPWQSEEGRRLYMLDLAHPRNFAADLAELPGVQILDLAQIFERVKAARAARAAQVPRAEAIVEAEVQNFVQWARGRETASVLRAVREQVLALAQQEAKRRGRGRSEAEQYELIQFARSLARALLHSPTVAIRDADPSSPEGQWILRTATTLFGLPSRHDVASGGKGEKNAEAPVALDRPWPGSGNRGAA